MTREDLCYSSAVELRQLLHSKELSPVELTDAMLERISEYDGKVHSFITLLADDARRAARDAEKRILNAGDEPLPALLGLPLGIKDLSDTAGIRTTFGDADLLENVPERDTLAVGRVRSAGPVVFGKTSVPLFGWCGTTENRIVGTTNNPFKLDRIAGGSSGGSAAGLASGFIAIATGSDGGGSIRIPASACGVVGMKVSHGRIPRGHEAALYETCTSVGPLGRTVADVAMMMNVMAGPDDGEPYSLPGEGVDYVDDLRAGDMRGKRIAYSADLGRDYVDPEVDAIVRAAVARFEGELSAHVEPFDVVIPDPMEYFDTYWGGYMADFLANDPASVNKLIDQYPWVGHMAEASVKLSAADQWRAATAMRGETYSGIAAVFSRHDFLMLPTMPIPPFKHPGRDAGPLELGGKKTPPAIFHRLTEPFSHTGYPAISINCGYTTEGLPVGLQIVGRQRDDRGVLRAAAAFEAISRSEQRRPNFVS